MNTLQLVNIFEKHDFDREEAIELAEAINGKSGLATKEDIYEVKEEIAELRSELKEEIAEVRGEIAELRSELKEEIAEVRGEIAELRSELKEEIAELRREMVELRSELKEDIAQNAKAIEKLNSSLKWIQIIIGLSFAVITTLLGIILAVGLGGVGS